MEQIDARYVILAAGSLGSTKLLLRMKQSGQLPHLSAALGTKWSGNGDLLGLCRNSEDPLYPSTGPVITGAIRFFHSQYPDGFPHGLFIEDAGIPNSLAWYLTALTPTSQSLIRGLKGAWRYLQGVFFGRREVNIGDDLGPLLVHESRVVSNTLVFLGMGRDRSTGVLRLRTNSHAPLKWEDECDLGLTWDSHPSQRHFERLRDGMKRLSAELGGQFQ